MATLFNHKNLEVDNKPLIKNIEFKELIAKIDSGEDVYSDALKTYSFETTQLRLLNQVYNQKFKSCKHQNT